MSKKPAKSSSNGHLAGLHHANGDTFLPPICVSNKFDSGDNASDEHETDDGVSTTVAPSTVVPSPPIRKFRKTKHKQPHNRHLVSKSSMSDSFVLPLIDFGGSPSTPGNGGGQRDPGWRENRAATHPDRKNERRYRGIPLSKSCPILSERRSTQRFNSTDYEDDEFESDDEDSDDDMDFKSMSFHVGMAPKMSRNRVTFDNNEHADDGDTNDVLCKLAKLESPRIKDLKHDSLTVNASGAGGTKLPDIFRDKSTDNDAGSGREPPRLAKKSLMAKYENANKQLPLDKRTKSKPGAKRHPDLSPSCNSRTLETRMSSTSWKLGASSSSPTGSDRSGGSSSNTNNTLVASPHLLPQEDGLDPLDDSTPSPRGNKTRRKTKKRHNEKPAEVLNNNGHSIKDNVEQESEAHTPDMKCRQWLDETQSSSSQSSSSQSTSTVVIEEVVK